MSFFDTYIYGYYGDPLTKLADMHTGGWHFLQGQTLQWAILLGFTKLFGSEVVAYNIVTMLSYLFAFVSVFLFTKYFLHFVETPCRAGTPALGVSGILRRASRLKSAYSASLRNTSAIVSATIFTFSQYMLWQGTQHLELVMAAGFIPIYFWRLFEFFKNSSNKNAMWLGVSFSALFLMSFYYGYFAGVLTGGMLVIKISRHLERSVIEKSRDLKDFSMRLITNLVEMTKSWLVFILTTFMLTLPATLSLIKLKLGVDMTLPEVSGIKTTLAQNDLNQIFRLTARPWDYLLPSINHPVFGEFVENFYQNTNSHMSWQLWSAYLPERAVCIGYTALILAMIGVLAIYKTSKSKAQISNNNKVNFQLSTFNLQLCTYLLIIIISSLWLSLPPYVSIHGNIIPISPNYFLFKLVPLFRAYIRYAIFVQFGIATLAGLGTYLLATRYPTRRVGYLITLGVISLVLFENLSLPLPFTKVNQLPQMYQYVRDNDGVVKIAEFPWDHDLTGDCGGKDYDTSKQKGYHTSYSLNFQRLHKKEVFFQNSKLSTFNSQFSTLSEQIYDLLKQNQVTHVLIHIRNYFSTPNPLDNCQPYRFYTQEPEVYEEFIKVTEFEDGVIYKVN